MVLSYAIPAYVMLAPNFSNSSSVPSDVYFLMLSYVHIGLLFG
jgi:hypothetical protein